MVHKHILPSGKVSVTFEMPASIWADSIHLVGDFNQWNTQSHPLKQRPSDGAWEITLVLDAGREYQYRYLVNGTDWQNDWQADQYKPNPYSTDNSVLVT
jgi:1,4-alpha-glucan branching enzyme